MYGNDLLLKYSKCLFMNVFILNVFSGKDTIKFLQGLCTNDLNNFNEECKAAAFLTPKGRIMTGALLYKHSRADNASVLVETHCQHSTALVAYLKQFKLRSKVTINAVPELQCHILDDNEDPANWKSLNPNCILVSADPRFPGAKKRAIVSDNGNCYYYLNTSTYAFNRFH